MPEQAPRNPPPMNEGEILLYRTPDGAVRVEVYFREETFWLTQARMAELFGSSKQAVSYHLRNIFETKELEREATVKEILTVQNEGGREVGRNVEYYNLDAVIAVGYRINSYEATQFRIWATKTLRDFIVKGFVLDDERLKQGKRFGTDYFDELLDRIRAIRASERRFYLKVTDIYEQCSVDYRKDADMTQRFFQTVQNKLHWAIAGKTAAEIVAERADSSKPNMGLTTWKNAPSGRITRADVSVAKNYLAQDEIKALERVVTMYLDYAENQAARRIAMRMQDWAEKLDAFLQFNEYQILRDAGRVTHAVAKHLAESEYDKFRSVEDRAYVSDFENAVKAVNSMESTAPDKKTRPRKRKAGE
jgi:hypothetical protein